jgi:hypothetical protein
MAPKIKIKISKRISAVAEIESNPGDSGPCPYHRGCRLELWWGRRKGDMAAKETGRVKK